MCRRFIYLFLLMAVFVGSAHAQFITSVAHRNTDSDAPEAPKMSWFSWIGPISTTIYRLTSSAHNTS
jgi:hypothetical protein